MCECVEHLLDWENSPITGVLFPCWFRLKPLKLLEAGWSWLVLILVPTSKTSTVRGSWRCCIHSHIVFDRYLKPVIRNQLSFHVMVVFREKCIRLVPLWSRVFPGDSVVKPALQAVITSHRMKLEKMCMEEIVLSLGLWKAVCSDFVLMRYRKL